jgi:DNA-binding NarL/FixJ family response regulator
MISGLEQSFKIVEERAIAVVKLLIAGKTVEQIANELKISQEKVAEIKKLFESD